ncbi:hypothetical protein M8542_40725 [Amycolatopsis sp. OK19-0408]|uniref:Uncharacterized protein n=1 Tax=Amycolatopsis iheyensis TaxID=2945988 RepID=A0A9X2NMM9_9PSEU|nr:hypothetical protein [Amycolatopsis iheyensis]MCR6489167.1 hypothetical protein [Amycolatopsis iheyensis]
MDFDAGLSRRARAFVAGHGVRLPVPSLEPMRARWLRDGIPAEQIDRAEAFHERWGGLCLPPSPCYDGGPRTFHADFPEWRPGAGWLFDAGTTRTALPYGFAIGPAGEFGLDGNEWSPLHASVEGWVESLALAAHATRWASRTTRLTGDAAEDFSLDGCVQIPEVAGLADTWWRGDGTLVAVHRGEARACAFPPYRTTLVHSGLADRDLAGLG